MSHWKVLAALLLLVVAACSRSAQREDTLRIAQQWQPRSLNPALENGTSSTEWSMLLFSYLVRYDDTGRLIPDLATQVPTLANGGISSDGKTIIYHIRKGVRFADGAPLTAADCAWSIEAINNLRNNVQSRFAYDDVLRADAPNPTTLVLHLKHPFPPIIVVVGAPQTGFPILPKHLLSQLPDFNDVPFDAQPLGSGPYVVTQWNRGDRVEMRANPYYWRGKPAIAHLTIQFVQSPQTAINMLRTGEVDGYFDEQDYANYPILADIPGYRTTSTPQNAVGALIFNTQDPVTSDPRVRHALAEAIDIPDSVRKTYRGALRSHDAGAGLFLWAFDPAAYPDVPFDPKAASSLLDQAGWRIGPDGIRRRNGQTMRLLLIIQAATPGDASLANIIVQDERAIGVGVTIKQFEISQFVAPANMGGPVYGGKFQMALYSFENGNDPDTTDQFACANVPPNGYNKSRICNSSIDALLKAGLATYDPAKRKAVYRRLEAVLYQQLPIALLYRRNELNVFTDRLHGQTTSVSGAFWNVAAWRLSAPASNVACAPRIFPAVGIFRRTMTALHGPGLLLQGGGTDIDQGFRWMHRMLTGSSSARGGNVLVLTARTDDNAYSPYIASLAPFQSVRTIGIARCATRAQVDAMAKYVDESDAVFFAGGDQANYVPWKGSKLIAAVQELWKRGGVVGGTSAGLAMQGAVDYDSVAADRLHANDDSYNVNSSNATADPYEPEISFTTEFLHWPPLRDTITDSHFARRDRFGRLVTFLARIDRERLVDGPAVGLGIDERSELAVDKNGIATLFEYRGAGYPTRGAYLLSNLHIETLAPDRPLVASVQVLHINRAGERFNLLAKTGSGASYRVAVDGARKSRYNRNPYDRP